MADYIRVCRQPSKPRLSVPSYLISEEESSGGNAFSLSDLINLTQLKKLALQDGGWNLNYLQSSEGCFCLLSLLLIHVGGFLQAGLLDVDGPLQHCVLLTQIANSRLCCSQICLPSLHVHKE